MSNTTKDGGQAFPGKRLITTGVTCGTREINEQGMSLRDYFAGQAMSGLSGNDKILEAMAKSTDSFSICARANAIMAYELSDAMLAERAKVTDLERAGAGGMK